MYIKNMNKLKYAKKSLTFDDIQIIPKYSEIESRNECQTRTKITKNFWIERPYISSPMDTVTGYEMAKRMMELGGLGCIHRFMSIDEEVDIVERLKHDRGFLGNYKYPICASVGVNESEVERVVKLINAGCDIILIDVAHGNTLLVKNMIGYIKDTAKEYGKNVDVIAGNVATKQGARNLVEWGADAIRCGIGGGSLCETRIRSGVGIAQASAIEECVEGADGIPVIADGGIKMVGDIAKAIGLGASTVMIGSLFSGTKETPGSIEKVGMFPNEKLYKKYRGSASLETKKAHGLDEKNVEGNSKLVLYKGKVKRLVDAFDDGLKSSMSYVNARTIEEFINRCDFVEITSNGVIEAKPHLLV